MAQIDRTEGLVGNTGYKAPCACATTANITLSGEQTIDGVTTSRSRVLVKDQTDATEIGIYVSDSGAWERADDFDGERDVATGTTVFVTAGTLNQGYWYVSTSGDPSPGEAMAFTQWNPISGRGAWLTATSYVVNDIVSDSGNSYICLVAHTSGTFATDLAAAKWLLLAAKGTDGADGADGIGAGDLISTNNLSDVANAATSRTNLGLAIGTDVHAHMASATQNEMETGTEVALRAMSPLRVAQAIAAIGGAAISTDVQTFNSSGTWTKPTGKAYALIECWGAGGSGGKGSNGAPGGGGGGGAYVARLMFVSALGATETVTIGAGGAAQTTAGTAGNAGGNTTFGAHLTGYGGGAGGINNSGGGGGGGGGSSGAGGNGSGATAGAAGAAAFAANQRAPFHIILAGGGTILSAGGAGGAGSSTAPGNAGGSTSFGGGGGGGGVDEAGTNGNAGGSSVFGGGGGGGASTSGTPGSGGTSTVGGNGGAAAIDANAATAGSAPSGGGGGSEAGDSGAGAAGKCVVTCW